MSIPIGTQVTVVEICDRSIYDPYVFADYMDSFLDQQGVVIAHDTTSGIGSHDAPLHMVSFGDRVEGFWFDELEAIP